MSVNHYDTPAPRIVTVSGRDSGKKFTEDLEVFEMITDELAACIEDIMSLVAVTKAPVHLKGIDQAADGSVQIAESVILSILATAKDSAYKVLSRCTGKEPEFFGKLFQDSNKKLVAAAIETNPDFFLTLLKMFGLTQAAQTYGQVSHQSE